MRLVVGLIVLAGLAGWLVSAQTAPTISPLPWPTVARDEAPKTLTLVLVGDTGLNGEGTFVSAQGARKNGDVIGWDEAIGNIAPEIDGDLNFANLETVVTERNDLVAEPKLFTFRTHPEAVRRLVRAGFNLFSAANNHAMDFGYEGTRETMRNLDLLAAEGGLIAYAGLGTDRDAAAAPKLFDLRGRHIAFSAIGIASSGTADADHPDQLAYQTDRDFNAVVAQLRAAPADFRILSVHHGNEFEVRTADDDRDRLHNRALLRAGIDLIVGHHQHVVAGVELTQGKVIFYGLGNFLHLGTQDMSAFDICRDYGLIARVYLAASDSGKFSVRAIEAIPIRRMHIRTARFAPQDSGDRIHVLNHLAEALDNPAEDAWGVRFAQQPSGTGLYCAPGAQNDQGAVGTMCASAVPLQPPPEALRQRIATACARSVTRPLIGGADPAAPVSE